MRNRILIPISFCGLAAVLPLAPLFAADSPADTSAVSPIACLHTMLENNLIGRAGPTEGKMPTMLNTNPYELLFKDEAGIIYTIEYPNVYKLNIDVPS